MNDDRSLFDDVDAFAKRDDPETSWAAADVLDTDTLRARLKAVYDCLKAGGPCHNDELTHRYLGMYWLPYQTNQSIRSRRAELTARGLCVDTGERVVLPTGRRAVIWAAV